MRNFIICGVVFLLFSCSPKGGGTADDSASAADVNAQPAVSPMQVLSALSSLALPFKTDTLPRNEAWVKEAIELAKSKGLHRENARSMGLRNRDSLELAADEPNASFNESLYWFLGKVGDSKSYTAVLVGSSGSTVKYSLVTFTPEGKIIDRLVLSEEASGEGQGYDTESAIDGRGTIAVKRSNTYSEPYEILGLTWETDYTIDPAGKITKGSSKKYYKEAEVEWFGIPDAGLLSVEKKRGNSVQFSLAMKSNPGCSGVIQGSARLQADGKSFVYRDGTSDSPCLISFTRQGDQIAVEEKESKGCDHGFQCELEGSYTRIASERFSGLSENVVSWLRKPVGEFACLLEKSYSFKDNKFKCGVKPAGEPDPKDPSWSEGPAFPKEKAKVIHPLITNVEIGWEHWDVRTLTFQFEREISVESVQRMFNLPRTEEHRSTFFPTLFDVQYGNLTDDDLNANSLKPLLVKEVTLVGFEHMGAGD